MAEATKIDKSVLDALMVGNAEIRMLDYNPEDWKTTGAVSLDFSKADSIFTLKDSLAFDQDSPSITSIKIDQGDAEIASKAEKGDFTFEGRIPSIAEAIFNKFQEKEGTATYTVTTGDTAETRTYTGTGYSTDLKKLTQTVLIVSDDKQTAVVFACVDIYAAFAGTSGDDPAGILMSGSIKQNPHGADYLILKQTSGSAGE